MPPKTKFKREDVVQAGLEVVRRHGLRELTARRIAKLLCSSTAPVYSQFSSIKELELAVVGRIRDRLVEYAMRPYTKNIFLNMGLGIPKFAREHPQLYRALFLEREDFKTITEEFSARMLEKMAEDDCLTPLDESQRADLLSTMWTFTHGLATLICVGLSPDSSDEFIHKMQTAVGDPVITAAIHKSVQINEQKKRGDI